MSESFQATSVTGFRERVASILEGEAGALRSRHIIILGIDGIPYNLAVRTWGHAKTEKMTSVFPTTSSSAWLSSLSGMDVDSHGIPGVIIKVPDGGGELINVFEYKGPAIDFAIENIFSDAVRFGYTPLSVIGDLEDYDCSWRDLLLRHSKRISGHRFYTTGGPGYALPDLTFLHCYLKQVILQSLKSFSRTSPCLLWVFIETDRHIHRFGYDEHVNYFLELIERTAIELMEMNAVVIAHSDHGLTRTSHDPRFQKFLEHLSERYHCSVGGAGRTRWLYPQPGTEPQLTDELASHLPSSVRIADATDIFTAGSLSLNRVGKIMLIAEGEEFLTPHGYTFDHGSSLACEVGVPFSVWHS